MRFGIVYRVICPLGKCYIGATILPLNRRKSMHRWCAGSPKSKIHNSKFSRAFREYGELLKWEIIHKNVPQSILYHLEKMEVEAHNSYKDGYNSTDNGRGKKQDYTDAERAHMSDVCSGELNGFFGRTHSIDTKRKVKISKYKNDSFKLSELTRSKMSESRRGDKNPMYGKPRSKRVKLRLTLKHTKMFKITNTITGEVREFYGLKNVYKYVDENLPICGRTLGNVKTWREFKLERK